MTRQDVHIVGGGLGGLTVAVHLSDPAVRSRFGDITVYERTNRLGGKGASSRGPDGRIEEHGLHIWFGYYENAFRLLDRCHAELDRLQASAEPGGARARWPGFTTVEKSFRPASTIGLADDQTDGSWLQWWTTFPEDRLAPWDREDDEEPARFDLRWYLPRLGERCAHLLAALLRSLSTDTAATNLDLGDVLSAAGSAVQTLSAPLGPILAAVVEASFRVRQAAAVPEANLAALAARAELRLLDEALDYVRDNAGIRLSRSAPARRLMAVLDLLIGVTRGLLDFGVVDDDDFDDLDDWEMEQWLSHNGVLPESRDCALVRALTYCLPFAYEAGDREAPCFSAGVGLRLFLRTFFTYRGALMWKMNAGMGEVVFMPIYELLCKRGVTFKFEHQLLNVKTDNASVETLHFVSAGDPDESGPRILSDGRREWRQPSEGRPFNPAGRPGDELPVSTSDAVVVLAVPIEALKWAAPTLFASPRWQRMSEIGTVATSAAQLWLKAPARVLGWPDGITASGFSEPFDTFADMSHLLAQEGRSEYQGLVYLCSAAPEPSDRERPDPDDRYLRSGRRVDPPAISGRRPLGLDRDDGDAPVPVEAWSGLATRWARWDLATFLAERAGQLWPRAYERYGDSLAGKLGFDNVDRWLSLEEPPEFDPASVYIRANAEPSDRYTLSLPGTLQHRMDPWDTGFVNLYVAGDWTRCVLQAGCIEAATISGMLAAEAITGQTMRIIGRRA